MAKQQRSWDEGAVGHHVPTTRAISSPLPYKTPKSPRNFRATPPNILYSTPTQQMPATPRSPSTRSGYSSGSRARYDPPCSPQITTTFANDSCDDSSSTPSSYYQTPTSGSMDSPSCSLFSGHTPISPRRSPNTPCKFVFDAISPTHPDQAASRKFEYYEPISPDTQHEEFDMPSPPQGIDVRRQTSKLVRGAHMEQMPQVKTYNSAGGSSMGSPQRRCQEWELPVVTHIDMQTFSAGANYYGMKRDSCFTDCTQLSAESTDTTNSTVVTTTTSFSYTDASKADSMLEHQAGQAKQRRHAINITSNPGYQVLHSSHSTLDRTCSDSVVSLRYRKSTSDLTQDMENEVASKPKPINDNGSYKPRRRGSSKGGLAYLASRRSSRESMKSACSNASIFSNDDIGPLAFQASNRGRQRRTSNFLELPVPDHVRPRVCSLPERPYNPRASDDLYRLRHFSISKGNVVNCGDSIISRRSRSNTSVNSTNSRASERSPFEGSCCGGGYANVDSLPASPDESENLEPPPPPRYRVVMLGDAGVGKTALVNQFMTSEYMHTYDASLDDEFGEKTVSVLLDDEESELVFIDHPSVEMSVENSLSTYEPHGCVVVFSVVDRPSFRIAEEIVNYLWQENYTKDKAVILVGNKADLARARVITSQEGKTLAASRDAKFIETSSGIQHNVDELLVGILKQDCNKLFCLWVDNFYKTFGCRLPFEIINYNMTHPISDILNIVQKESNSWMRLKATREKKATASKMKTSRTHISLHLAKEIFQKICLSDISKSKSCENLHVL